MSPPSITPHRTRVVVADRGAGMVVAVHNARRRPVRSGWVEVPARVTVVLDEGGKVTVRAADVEVEAAS